MADFDRIAEKALSQKAVKTPRIIYELYYRRRIPYTQALRICKRLRICKETTFDYWLLTLKVLIGIELKKSLLFPPRDYFTQVKSAPAARFAPGGSVQGDYPC